MKIKRLSLKNKNKDRKNKKIKIEKKNFILILSFQSMTDLENISVNPWAVETLDVYLHYCCPECDQKYKTKLEFVNHAYSYHPEAKEILKFEDTGQSFVFIRKLLPIHRCTMTHK